MDARGATGSTDASPHDASHVGVHDATGDHHHLIEDSLEKYEDTSSDLGGSSSRKRELDGGDDYDDDDDDDASTYGGASGGKDDAKDGKLGRGVKRTRRHNWQPKYEMEFGLIAIEKDQATGDVSLAMCGFCKAFGREGKYEQLLQAEAEAAAAATSSSAESKKRRRRSLTTTKFFRAFRVDNIRSHLQGAHPRRWAEYEMLPKQEAPRARYLQMQGDLPYEGLHMVDDVVSLSGSSLNTESDMAYAQAQAQALAHPALSEEPHQPTTVVPAATTTTTVATTTAGGLNGSHAPVQPTAAVQTYMGESSCAVAICPWP